MIFISGKPAAARVSESCSIAPIKGPLPRRNTGIFPDFDSTGVVGLFAVAGGVAWPNCAGLEAAHVNMAKARHRRIERVSFIGCAWDLRRGRSWEETTAPFVSHEDLFTRRSTSARARS